MIILLTCFIAGLLPISASKRNRYLPLDLVSGLNPELSLLMHPKSFNLDLLKTQNIRVRLKVSDLYKNINRVSSFKVNIYEIIGSDRKFVSSQNLTVKRGSSKSRILALDAGYFASPTKNVEIDVFDTASNVVNTYETQLTALNIDTQVLANNSLSISSADCDVDTFDDCHLDYLFQKITFEAKPQRQISTRVVKGEDGLYKVTIPVPRSKFNYLGRKVRKQKVSLSSSSDVSGATTSDFGETLNISSVNIGVSLINSMNIGFGNGQLNINDSFYFDPGGKLGIGVQDPLAWLHVRGGDSETPSLILNAGALTDTPLNGALEFDGAKLYFTNGGSRAELGAQGPAGTPGATGATGGAILNGSTLNGSLTVADTVNARLFNGQVFNGGIFNGTFYGDGSNLTGVVHVSNAATANFADSAGIADSMNGGSLNNNTELNGQLLNGTINGANIINSTVELTYTVSTKSLDPVDDSSGHGVDDDLTITFNSIVLKGNGDFEIRELVGDAVVETIDVTSSKISLGNNVVTINPGTTLDYSTAYYITSNAGTLVSGVDTVSEWAGISDNSTWNFTTEAPPGIAVSSRSPSDNGTGLSRTANLSVTFNVPVTLYAGNATILYSGGSNFETISLLSGQVTLSNGDRTVNINPSVDFAYSTAYYVEIDANKIENSYTGADYFAGYSGSSAWNFTSTGIPATTINENYTLDASPDYDTATSAVDLTDIGGTDSDVTTVTITNNKVAGDSTAIITFNTTTNKPTSVTLPTGEVQAIATDPVNNATRFVIENQQYSFYVDGSNNIVFTNEPNGLGVFTARILSVELTNQ